jgi:peptidoglycan/LPS O-acetylase OafA/YrhL
MNRKWIAQAGVVINGLSFTLVGLALIAAPHWFFENIGTFPPFNRHYAGDLGTYSLPLGIALLFAARFPTRHRLLIGAVVGISILHLLNYIYDAVIAAEPLSHWFQDVVPLVVTALLLIPAVVAKETNGET